MTVLAIPLMAFANRWRGGGWPFLPGEIHGGPNDHKRTQVRRIAFAAMGGLLAWNPLVAVALYLSSLVGWGFPVSAAMGKRRLNDFESEWAPLDWLAKALCLQVRGRYESQAYGVAWLTLHGLLFGGLCVAATGGGLAYLLLALMGLCYRLAKDWERGEWVFGGMIGAAVFLAGAVATV